MGTSWNKKDQVLTMKSFIALCLVASVLRARADVHVGVATVMCNCGAQVDTYNAYNSAAADCAAYMGAGAASCVATVAWSWPGSFDFNALDAALSDFFTCANDAAVSACQDSLGDQLNSCLATVEPAAE